jgi:hypothetical protein
MAKTSAKAPSTKFTAERLKAFSKDLQTQRVPLERQQISDDMVVGLRAMIHKSGLIAFHVSYYVGDKRPFMRIGTFDDPNDPDYISIEDAREVAKTIKALGEKGIDVQDGLQRRLVRELKEKGVGWRVPK